MKFNNNRFINLELILKRLTQLCLIH